MMRETRSGNRWDGTWRRGRPMTGWPDQPVIYEVNTAIWLLAMT